MQDPQERAAETRVRDTGLIPLDSFDEAGLEPLRDAAPPYVQEPLFNKKVMALWALGALAVWFAFSMVLPAVVEATRTSVREAVREIETGSDGTITIRRNGKVISITRGAEPSVTVTRDTKGASPATPPPPAGALPPAEVAPPAKR